MMFSSDGIDFCCYNPLCASCKSIFTTDKALSIHFARAAACAKFDQINKMRKRELQNSDVLFRSTKQAKTLRSDVVNVDHNCIPIAVLPAFLPTSIHTDDCATGINDTNDIFNDSDHAFEENNDMSDDGGGKVFATNELSVSGQAVPSDVPLMYTTDQKWTVRLLKLLDDFNAPDYAFESIIRWSRGAHEDNYSFYPPGGLSRSRNVDVLFSSMDNATKLLPSVQRVVVPHGLPCDVIVYDFVLQLLKLLQDPNIMVQANLTINLLQPLDKFSNLPTSPLGDVLSGSVYQHAYNTFIKDPSRELFVPIIQWIDRTSITGNSRFLLKPYMFTPAIFTETFRRTIQAWGYHGFCRRPNCLLLKTERNHKATISAITMLN